MTTRKPTKQMPLPFNEPNRARRAHSSVVSLQQARVVLERRERGALYEAIISRAAHLLNGDKKKA